MQTIKLGRLVDTNGRPENVIPAAETNDWISEIIDGRFLLVISGACIMSYCSSASWTTINLHGNEDMIVHCPAPAVWRSLFARPPLLLWQFSSNLTPYRPKLWSFFRANVCDADILAVCNVRVGVSVSRTSLWGASLSLQSSLISCMHLLRHEHTCIPGVSRKW